VPICADAVSHRRVRQALQFLRKFFRRSPPRALASDLRARSIFGPLRSQTDRRFRCRESIVLMRLARTSPERPWCFNETRIPFVFWRSFAGGDPVTGLALCSTHRGRHTQQLLPARLPCQKRILWDRRFLRERFRNLAVAVGTIIADRPPRRSVRALLRIRLPPRMSRVEAWINSSSTISKRRQPKIKRSSLMPPTVGRAMGPSVSPRAI
jgi:hypothetical protein